MTCPITCPISVQRSRSLTSFVFGLQTSHTSLTAHYTAQMRLTLAEQPTGNTVVETEAIWVSRLVRAAFDFGDCYLSSIAKSLRRGHAVIAGKQSGRRQSCLRSAIASINGQLWHIAGIETRGEMRILPCGHITTRTSC